MKRVKKYPGSSQQTTISTVLNNGIIKHFTSDRVIDALRNAVGAIGKTKLGFKKEDVGTHSIRSGAAMAMYLGECPVFMIMLIGRWSSDAFLIPLLHQKTGNGIQPKCGQENALVSKLQAHPRHPHESTLR